MSLNEQSLNEQSLKNNHQQPQRHSTNKQRNSMDSSRFEPSDFFNADDVSVVSGVSVGDGRDSAPHGDHEKQREMVKTMAARETRRVNVWRRNVIIVIALTAAFVTGMTYFFLAKEDHEDFEQSFREFAQTIEESTEFNLKGLIEGTNGLSQVLTSEAISTGSEWPFMTLSSFEVYVRNTRTQGASELVVFAPFVAPEQIEAWNDYSKANQGWIDQSFLEYDTGRPDLNPIPTSLYRFGRFKGRTVLKPEDGLHTPYPSAPFWQMSRPPFDTSIVNFNALSEESYQQSFRAMNVSRSWVLGIAGPNTLIDYTISAAQHDQLHSEVELDLNNTQAGFANDHPHTQLIYPVFQSKDPSHPSGGDINSPIVAMIVNILPWDNYLKRLLPDGVNGIYCILHNSAGQSFTYVVNGPKAVYLGAGDLHHSKYNDMEYRIDFDEFLGVVPPPNANRDYFDNALSYWLSVYPSPEFESDNATTTPIVFAIVVASSFSFMLATFLAYDRFVISKNNKIMDAATHSNAILASLFPKNVQERLLQDKANEIKAIESSKKRASQQVGGAFVRSQNTEAGLQAFIDGSSDGQQQDAMNSSEKEILDSDPIADLFPEATVLFADLVGFTAWSSTREPTQVFILLETLYRNFDLIAKRRRVYKIETIGDCYVAVTGCPTPRKNHHVIMVRFCMECLGKMKKLTRKLESKLGPDTSTLNMRFGLHSGPVTGGVLRGERSRFQLFGDTMNTAARMESNGKPGKIHLSEATAALLRQHGKGHWLELREDKVQAKGKGLMQTYWIGKFTSGGSGPSEDGTISEGDPSSHFEDGVAQVNIGGLGDLRMDEKTHRVVEWTTQSLMTLLENLEASRGDCGEVPDVLPDLNKDHRSIPLEELQEVITFPQYPVDPEKEGGILLGQDVEDELEYFIGLIATKYPVANSFHSFFHASHVTMTLLKLLNTMRNNSQSDNTNALGARVTSDPLTIFACAFAALIHDTEHPGVPNFVFKHENAQLAGLYAGRCIAEQHSFDVAWKILSQDQFAKLRAKIVRTDEEAIRFRQLVINAIMATDLFDADLNRLRNEGWEKAFGTEQTAGAEESPDQVLDRKATIVIDHLIQASDISHTMLHWEIYRKWNTNLFEEMYKAYADGRSSKDPSESWYQGELNFYDSHVLPLAERLTSCKCFGVTSHEFLSNAKSNRAEWAEKGHSIVAEMLQQVQTKNGEPLAEANIAKGPPLSVATNDTSNTSNQTENTANDFKLLSIDEVENRTLELEVSQVSGAERFRDELDVESIGSTSC